MGALTRDGKGLQTTPEGKRKKVTDKKKKWGVKRPCVEAKSKRKGKKGKAKEKKGKSLKTKPPGARQPHEIKRGGKEVIAKNSLSVPARQSGKEARR